MGHYAKIDENNIVVRVSVSSKEMIDSGKFGPPEKWIKTSYNTAGGKHYNPDADIFVEDDKPPIRKNFAGIGYTYDSVRDAFIAPQPYPSWILNEDTCTWMPPVAYPIDGREKAGEVFYGYEWNEEETNWTRREGYKGN